MGIKEHIGLKHYPFIIFFVVLAITLVLNYFNLTLGLGIRDLIKADVFITLWISLYFKDREWFKFISSVMISLILLMVLVDFLEKNLYFGIGSPNALRLILVVGGGTAIVMGNLMYLKWKMGEL